MEKKELLAAWLKAKKAEEKAKKSRNEIETEIAALYGTTFDGGSKTFKEDDGFKVTIKKNVVYSLDQDAWKTARLSLLDNERPEKIKFELDKTGYEWLRNNNPAQFKIVSDCVSMKENKPTISVEKI